jgi:hypothetical protein
LATLLEQLRGLEVELHHPGAACTLARLEALLHPDFREVGRSGTAYLRATVIHHLLSVDVRPAIESADFGLRVLAEDAALLTYRSWQRDTDGTQSHCALRSSVWHRSAAGWQLRYHQGTPCRA